MAQKYPKVWDWSKEAPPSRLANFIVAPARIGVYEIGFIVKGRFIPKYCGRAKGKTLRQRLSEHFRNSHNLHIRQHRHKLYFRYKIFNTQELSAFVEAVSITALEYPWNGKNEWQMHSVLDI